MSARFSSGHATRSLPDSLDLQMLHDAQVYLRCRQRRQTPSTSEEEAWQWFCQTYEPQLANWILRYHVHRNDLKDCLQDILVDVMKKLPSFLSDGTQRGLCCWLRAIVQAKAVDLLRYQKRHPYKHFGLEAEATLVSRDGSPAAEYERQRRQEAVQRVLGVLRQKISALSFRAFFMHWIEKSTIGNIAAELHVTQRAVRRRLSKAKRLFAILCEMDGERDFLIDG